MTMSRRIEKTVLEGGGGGAGKGFAANVQSVLFVSPQLQYVSVDGGDDGT